MPSSDHALQPNATAVRFKVQVDDRRANRVPDHVATRRTTGAQFTGHEDQYVLFGVDLCGRDFAPGTPQGGEATMNPDCP